MTITVITENLTAVNAAADEVVSGVADTYINVGSPDTNYSSGTNFRMREDGNEDQRAILEMDLSGISGPVSSAVLYLVYDFGSSPTRTFDVYELLEDETVVSLCTYNTYDGTNSWGAAGADQDGVDYDSTVIDSLTAVYNYGDWYSWDITGLVNAYRGGVLRIIVRETGLTGGGAFRSRENSDGDRPELVVDWSAGSGAAITGDGTPSSQSATASGSGEAFTIITGSGSPQAQSSTASGVGDRVITGDGSTASQDATASGAGEAFTVVSGTGILGSGIAFVAGDGAVGRVGTGALASNDATVSGTGEIAGTTSGSGTLQAQESTVSGVGEREVTGTGSADSQAATVAGTGDTGAQISGSGSLDAQASSVSGTGARAVSGTGSLDSAFADAAGLGEISKTGSGSLQAQASQVTGVGGRVITGSGVLAANDAIVSGVGSSGEINAPFYGTISIRPLLSGNIAVDNLIDAAPSICPLLDSGTDID